MPTPAPLKTFYKVGDGFLYTNWCADGAPVRLNENQARYPLMSGHISRTQQKPVEPPKVQPKGSK